MHNTHSLQRISLRERHAETLRQFGMAVEYFPHYVNRGIRLQSLDVVLLSCIIRGRGRHLIANESFAVTGPSVAVTHYDQHHSIVTGAQGMEIFNVYLDLQNHPLPVLSGDLQPLLSLLLPLHPRFAHRLNRIVRLEFQDAGPLAELLFALRDELQFRPPGYAGAISPLWQLFLIRCCRRALDNGFAPPTETLNLPQQKLEDLRQHLDQTYRQPHTLGALAQRARLGRTYLCRTFKAYTGKTIFNYLIERRVQAAMLRLRSGQEKILVVALESGFQDAAYFNRKFRQIVGCTPSMYRGKTKRPLPPAASAGGRSAETRKRRDD